MALIEEICAREILDSRGNPTVEVDVKLTSGHTGRAGVPSGASTGAHEAHELRDQDSGRYGGKGVLKAVAHVNGPIFEALKGQEASSQTKIDQQLIDLDGTENKSKWGANSILGVSMAVAKASAAEANKPVFQYLGGESARRLPAPLMNVINGGAHADNGLDVQEFMIVPIMDGKFSDALRAGSEIFHKLKGILKERSLATGVGDEGGFAPYLKSNEEALELLLLAIEGAGYRPGEDVVLALDVAATEIFKDNKYVWEGKPLEAEELGEIYASWLKKFPLVSIEDGFSEDDWKGWETFTASYGDQVQLIGDDLFVTNPKRIALGIEKRAANSLLVKVNQIGTLTETQKAVDVAQSAGFHTIMSHRSGETEDSIIADLSVAMGCEQIKTGSLCRGERIAKYNQLLRIEEFLGEKSSFIGSQAFST